MKAISIKQPWAKLIAQGHKTVEVRSWQTSYRGDLLICSSAKPENFLKIVKGKVNSEGHFCECEADNYWSDFYHFGKALFICELHKITPFEKEHEFAAMVDYSPGLFAWHLQNIRQIEPFEVKGKLNFFNVDFKL